MEITVRGGDKTDQLGPKPLGVTSIYAEAGKKNAGLMAPAQVRLTQGIVSQLAISTVTV
jgi:hypothetical protein